MSTASVLDRTKALVPYLLEQAQRAEADRRLPPETFDALADAGILRMCVSRKYGGDELPFETQCEVLAEVARGCPSSSWVATILSAMGWWASTFCDEAQDEVLGDGDPRISGVLSPTGTLEPTDGGYRMNGRWAFNTGGHGSSWAILNALLEGVPTAVRGAVVGADATRRLARERHGGDREQHGHRGGCLHPRVPDPDHDRDDGRAVQPTTATTRLSRTSTCRSPRCSRSMPPGHPSASPGVRWTPSCSGSLAAPSPTPTTPPERGPDHPPQVGEAALIIDSADAHMRLAARILDQPAEGSPSFFDRVKGRAHVAYLTGLSRQAVDILFLASGASSIQEPVPIQRFQRDIQALANHAIMHAPTGNEIYGRVLCGLPPNTLIV